MTGLQNSTLHGYSDSDPMVDAHGLDNGVDVDDVPSEVHDIHCRHAASFSMIDHSWFLDKALRSPYFMQWKFV